MKKALAHAEATAEAKHQQVSVFSLFRLALTSSHHHLNILTGVMSPCTHALLTSHAARRRYLPRGHLQVSSTGNGHTTTVDDAEAASQPRVARQRQQTYPDLMDIAGMDYSPATRKPPIHN